MMAWFRSWWGRGAGRRPANLRRGRLGEEAAARHLSGAGWRILARNYSAPRGELDLVAWDGECMAFVEVKARSVGSWGRPADAVDREKRRRVTATALHYLRAAGTPPVRIRFDIVEVVLDGEHVLEVRHLQDAFRMEGGLTYP